MLPQQITDTLARCEQHYRSGQYDTALAELGALSEIDRCEPVVLAAETRVCIAAGDWEHGLQKAYACEFSDDEEYKIAAAEFYAAYAGHLCGAGEMQKAKMYVREASRVWPPIRLQMLEDKGFAAIFGG